MPSQRIRLLDSTISLFGSFIDVVLAARSLEKYISSVFARSNSIALSFARLYRLVSSLSRVFTFCFRLEDDVVSAISSIYERTRTVLDIAGKRSRI